MKDFGRLLRYARPYLGRLLAAFVCAVLLSAVVLALVSLVNPLMNEVLLISPQASSPQKVTTSRSEKVSALSIANKLLGGAGWIGRYSDWGRKLMEDGGRGTFLAIAVLIVFLYLVKAVLTYFNSYYVRYAGLQVIFDLRHDLYQRIQRQSLGFFSAHPTGQLISRITYDIARLQRTISGDLANILRLGCIIVGQMVLAFYLYWNLSLICLVALPLIVYPVLRFGRRLKTTSRLSQEQMAEVTSVLKETITGSRIVKGFGMEEYEVRRFRDALKKVLRQQLRSARIVSVTPPVMELLGALIGGLLVIYAGYNIAMGRLNPGEFITFLITLGWLYTSIKSLAKINNDLQQSMAAAHRVFEMMDAKMEIEDRANARPLPPFQSQIVFEDVHFSYPDRPVLRGANLTVKAGEVVAIVGSSGAGKTTLMNLLPRFYDVTEGRIAVDGWDVREVTLASLRKQIGIVTQEVLLFDDTVINNIAYGRRDVPLSEVEKAARAAYAHEFVARLPQGYETRLGEGGHFLSVGERQRISIARALLKDSPILIMDEATSALDTESEAIVQKALENLMKGRTVIVIAHRLSTIRNADTIAVLEKGRIIEQGNHEHLLAARGAYARLYDQQFRNDSSATG